MQNIFPIKHFCHDISYTNVDPVHKGLLVYAHIWNVQQNWSNICYRNWIGKLENQAETSLFQSGVRYIFMRSVPLYIAAWNFT